MNPFLVEIGFALGIEQAGGRIGKLALGIGGGFVPLCFDKDAPARAEATKGIVDARRHRDKLCRDGGVEIGAAKPRGALKTAVLVEHDARRDECCPRQIVGKASSGSAVFGKAHHSGALKPKDVRGAAGVGAQPRKTADRAWRPIPP